MTKEQNLIYDPIWNRIINRWLISFYLRPFVRSRSKLPREVIHRNIYLFSYPRSGSTWLEQLLLTIPKSGAIHEPLWRGQIHTDGTMPSQKIGRCDEVRNLDFYFTQPIPEEAEWSEAEEFFKSLLKLEIGKLGLFNECKLSLLKDYDRFIFKFCYGNLLMTWLIKKFAIKPILLVRHPCAVVHSQLMMKNWKLFLTPELKLPHFKFSQSLEEYSEVLESINTVEEKLAAYWCINHVGILSHSGRNSQWLMVTYEELLKESKRELHRIFDWIDVPLPQEIWNGISTPSKSTNAHSIPYLESNNQLSAWQERLTHDQVSRILNVVKTFNIELYNDSIYPNHSK